jgi:hypothetical protein
MSTPTKTAATKLSGGDLKELYKPLWIAAVCATAACRGSAASKAQK